MEMDWNNQKSERAGAMNQNQLELVLLTIIIR
jgi:hypothetical protein